MKRKLGRLGLSNDQFTRRVFEEGKTETVFLKEEEDLPPPKSVATAREVQRKRIREKYRKKGTVVKVVEEEENLPPPKPIPGSVERVLEQKQKPKKRREGKNAKGHAIVDALDFLLENYDEMNDWEQNFIGSVDDWWQKRGNLTSKQDEKLFELVERLKQRLFS